MARAATGMDHRRCHKPTRAAASGVARRGRTALPEMRKRDLARRAVGGGLSRQSTRDLLRRGRRVHCLAGVDPGGRGRRAPPRFCAPTALGDNRDSLAGLRPRCPAREARAPRGTGTSLPSARLTRSVRSIGPGITNTSTSPTDTPGIMPWPASLPSNASAPPLNVNRTRTTWRSTSLASSRSRPCTSSPGLRPAARAVGA